MTRNIFPVLAPSIFSSMPGGVIKGLFSYRLLFAMGRGAFSTFLPIFAAFNPELTTSLIGVLVSTYILLMSLFQGVSGRIADLVNINSVFYFASGMVVIGTGLFTWFTMQYPLHSQ